MLNINADHLTRSKVLYHPSVVENKQEDIILCLASSISKGSTLYQDATTVFELNKDCEVKLLVMIREQLPDIVAPDSVTVSLTTLEILNKLRGPHL